MTREEAMKRLEIHHDEFVENSKLGIASVVFDPVKGALIGFASTPALPPLSIADILLITIRQLIARATETPAKPEPNKKIHLA